MKSWQFHNTWRWRHSQAWTRWVTCLPPFISRIDRHQHHQQQQHPHPHPHPSVSQLIKLDDVRRQRRLPEQSCGAAGAVLASGHYWPVMTSHTDDDTHQLNDVCPSVRLSQRVSLQDTIEHRLPYHLPRRRHDYHKLIGLYVRHLPYRYKRFTTTPEVSPAILGLNWQAVGMCVRVCVMLPGVSFLRLNRQDTVGFGWPVTTHSSSALLPIEYCNSVGVSANFMSSIWYHNTWHITDTLTSQLKWR